MRPEAVIQKNIIEYLRMREWFVKPTHGNMYQQGFPDLFCCHSDFGHRWVEVKVMPYGRFTPAQLKTFPKLCAHGSGVWVMVGATAAEYEKLRKRPNWWCYTDAWRGR